jgi:hypothetical protein
MRVLMKVSVPVESGNKAMKDGSMGKIIGDTVERIRPEAAYFGLEGGKRTAFFVFDLKNATDMPSIGEPILAALHANLEVTPVMTAQDLKAGLEAWQRQG